MTSEWIKRSAIVIVAATVMSALMFVLHVAAVIKPRAQAGPTFTVEPLGERIDNPKVAIVGTAPAHSAIVAKAGNRTLGRGSAGADGRYRIEIVLPQFAQLLSVEATPPGTSQFPYRTTVSIPPWRAGLVATSIDVAMYLTDAGVLWVAGRGGSGQALELSVDALTPPQKLLSVQGGVFETFVPLDSPPGRVTVTMAGGASPRPSTSRAVTHTKLADVPLSRRGAVELSPEWKLKLQVSLPPTHPLLTAARLGYLDGYSAVFASWGWISSLKDASVRVVTEANHGSLMIEGTGWSQEFRLSPGYGLGSVPFLGARDELTIILPSTSRTWFEEQPPVELTAEKATWRGPLPVTDDRPPIIVVGVEGAPQGQRRSEEARHEPETPRERPDERLREFLVAFEAAQVSPYVGWPLWVLKALIPFAGLLWLSRRAPFNSVAAWQPFVAALCVMSVWRSWPFLQWLTDTPPLSWLSRATSPALRTFKEIEYIYPYLYLDSFWLMFVTFVALTPVYFRAVAAGALPWDAKHTPPPRARWMPSIRAVWTGLRVALGGAALFLLVAMVRPECLGLSTNPLSAVSAHFLPALAEPALFPVFFATVLSFLFLAFGLRAWLIGLGLVLITLRLSVPEKTLEAFGPFLPDIHRMPYWVFATALGVLALPLMARLVGVLTPEAFLRRRWRWLLAAFLTAAHDD